MASKPRVVIGRPLPEAGLGLLRTGFAVEVRGEGASREWLREHVPGAAAIIADPSIRVDAALLDAAGETLKVVSNFGVGSDNIDLEAARARGVRATNTPDVPTSSTAELAVALMLAAGRRIAEADGFVRADRWRRAGAEQFLGRDLSGATVGLVGFGRICRRVAELLEGFAVRLLFHSDKPDPTARGAERRELPDLLGASDFVSLHVPLTPQTTHLIDAAELRLMKPGSILVNTSRGAVVNTSALIEALSSDGETLVVASEKRGARAARGAADSALQVVRIARDAEHRTIGITGSELAQRALAKDDGTGLAHHLDHFLAQSVHARKVRTHPLQHDLPVNVHHVRMANLPPIHHVSHLNPRSQFVRLHLHRKNRNLACLQVVQDRARQITQRTLRHVFEHPRMVRRSQLLEFMHNRRRNLGRRHVGDDANLFRRLNAQAHVHRVERPR